MCTLTWLTRPDGFELFMNRDELSSRRPALPPRALEAGGARALAPLDADAGGTWIGAGERGLALCVLNGYPDAGPPPELARSRGLLALDLLFAQGLEQARARLAAADLTVHRPFTLVAFEPGRAPVAASWSGRALSWRELADSARPLVSAGERAGERAAARRAALDALARRAGRIDAAVLRALHASHDPVDPAAGPCVHGEIARTVSFTRVAVSAGAVELEYVAGAPCAPSAEPIVARLARA